MHSGTILTWNYSGIIELLFCDLLLTSIILGSITSPLVGIHGIFDFLFRFCVPNVDWVIRVLFDAEILIPLSEGTYSRRNLTKYNVLVSL